MLRLDDYAMYSLKRIFDMRHQVQELSRETPLSLRPDVINLIGTILMIEANMVAYVINLASESINTQVAAFTQEILRQAGWQPSWHLHIKEETVETIIEQHKLAEEKGHTSMPSFTPENRLYLHYGYPPALIIEGLYQDALNQNSKS